MYQALIVIHVIVAASLIGLVLIQHGKGADAGAAFGSGSSSTVFGARGSASFLTRSTGFLAAGFFVTSLVLGYMTLQLGKSDETSIPGVPTEAQPVETPASDIPDVPVTPTSDIPDVPAAPAAEVSSPESSDIPAVPEAEKPAPATDADVNKIPE